MSTDTDIAPPPDARAFAAAAHDGQRYGTEPYIVHLDAVVRLLREHGYGIGGKLGRPIYSSPEDGHFQEEVGYLHDVIEDVQGMDGAQLRQAGFAPLVIQAVEFCTDEPGPNRKSRKAATYERCRRVIDGWNKPWNRSAYSAAPFGIRAKVADRLANVLQSKATNPGLLMMYQREYEDFCFAYYAPGICDDLWESLWLALNEGEASL